MTLFANNNNNDMTNSTKKMLSKSWILDRKADLFAVGFLAILAAWLFRKHLGGELTFLGNPDRLNNNLKILRHYIESLASGGLSAWNGTELLGYDTFSLPYTFPNPLTFLTYWLGAENLYVVAGYVSAMLLACSGVCAYAFVRSLVRSQTVALVAGILYQFAAISILKLSQNDMSFAVLILIPLLMLTIRRIEDRSLVSTFLLLSLILFAMLQFTFLQKAAYAVMLTSSYALYRGWVARDWRPIAIFAAALSTATVAAFPRLYSLRIAMTQYTRQLGQDAGSFDSIYQQQGVFPYQILRWFDGSIFGGHFSDATALVSGLNLSEGFLLYTCALTPFLIIFAFGRYRSRWLGAVTEKQDDVGFYSWVLLFVFSVILFKPVVYLMYRLFYGVDFIHARVLIIGLLPLVTLVALTLESLVPASGGNIAPNATAKDWGYACLLSALIVIGIEIIAQFMGGVWKPFASYRLSLSQTAIARITLSGITVSLLLAGIVHGKSSGSRRLYYQTLLISLALQTVVAGDAQINSAFNVAPKDPFQKGDIYFAPREDFRIPSTPSVQALHERLRPDLYRSVVVCNAQIAGGFCAAHIGEFWRLRVADGYYGMGVPMRIAALPWGAGLGQRQVIFTSVHDLPWRTLGFLNVRYAVIADDKLYRNISRLTEDDWPNLAQHRPEIIENPATTVPRAFFAERVYPVESARDAAGRIFSNTRVVDVTETSFAEDFGKADTFVAGGKIIISGDGDRITLTLDKAANRRFLVLNELYYPGWSARVDGTETTIFATNVVMRGVIVPPNATDVTFTYTPFVKTSTAKILYAAGLMLAVVCVLGFRRLARDS